MLQMEENSKRTCPRPPAFWSLVLWIWDLFRISDFGFRICGFRPALPASLLLLLVLLSATASPAATRVYAKVDAETAIYPGQDFTYSVVVDGGGRPSKTDISPLAPFSPRKAGSGTSMQTVNDRTTVSYSDNFVITAGKPGVMHLPGVTVIVDGQTFTTNPVEVTVSQPGTTDRMSLALQISDQQCYVGQPLVMTVEWAVSTRFQDGSVAFDVPVFRADEFYLEDVSEGAGSPDGQQATIHDVPVLVTRERRLVRGVETAVFSFRKVLIPKRAGRLRLDPLTVSANLAVGRERRTISSVSTGPGSSGSRCHPTPWIWTCGRCPRPASPRSSTVWLDDTQFPPPPRRPR